MVDRDGRALYKTLLATFIQTSVIKRIELRKTLKFNDLVFVGILRKANEVVENFYKDLDGIFEESKEQLESNNIGGGVENYNYKKIEKDFQKKFNVNKLYDENKDIFDERDLSDNTEFDERDINKKINFFYDSWKTIFLKKVEKNKKVSSVKYSYFHLIESLFSEINKNFFHEIENVANLFLKEVFDGKQVNNKIDLIRVFTNKHTLESSSKIKFKKIVFLSYAFDDRLYTLLLFVLAKNHNVFLFVDWMINEKEELDGSKLKKNLLLALNDSDELLFLRTLNSEFDIRGSAQVRQWCSWELGVFHHRKGCDGNSSLLRIVNTEYLTGDKDERFEGLTYRPVLKKGKKKIGKKNELFLDGIAAINDIDRYFRM